MKWPCLFLCHCNMYFRQYAINFVWTTQAMFSSPCGFGLFYRWTTGRNSHIKLPDVFSVLDLNPKGRLKCLFLKIWLRRISTIRDITLKLYESFVIFIQYICVFAFCDNYHVSSGLPDHVENFCSFIWLIHAMFFIACTVEVHTSWQML